jgi:hypothetical protein
MHVYFLSNVPLHLQRAGEVNEKMTDMLEQGMYFVKIFNETSSLLGTRKELKYTLI